jgi:non-specific serine/threonine protein kinase
LAELQKRCIKRRGNVLRFNRYTALTMTRLLQPFWRGAQAPWQQLRQRLSGVAAIPELPAFPPLSRRLRDYQREGVAWIRLLADCGFHGVLADEMGLGKTVQALAVLAAAKAVDRMAVPSLVACPASLLENWSREAHRFAPELRTVVVRGDSRLPLISGLADYDLAITSYSLLRRDIAAYQDLEFNYVILDEAQHIKNPLTANARACKKLRARNRLILTGTPLENNLQELWSVFDFLLPGFLGSRRQFTAEHQNAARQSEAAHAARVRELAAQVRPFILRRTKKAVCTELPPKMEQVVYCEFEREQQRLYDYVSRRGRELLQQARQERGRHGTRLELLTALLRLRQVCCHPRLLPAELVPEPSIENGSCSAKTELAQEIILEAIDSGHRMLFFSQFTSMLQLLRPWLEKNSIPYEYLDGGTKSRQDRVDRFNRDSNIPLFLLSLRAGGVGLNLTGADTVILYDQWWNPMVEDQATDRTHRIGQEQPVTALRLVVRGTIEERILSLQENKRELFRSLLNGVPSRLGEISVEDLEFLLERS